MEKEKVLVRDDKGVFLKMFKEKLIDEFDFTESLFLMSKKAEIKNIDRFIFVVYNKQELIKFLKLDKKGSIVLVCLFDEKLRNNISFLEEISNLIVLDGYKTKRKIISDIKLHLKSSSNFKKPIADFDLPHSNISKVQYHSFFKSMFLFV